MPVLNSTRSPGCRLILRMGCGEQLGRSARFSDVEAKANLAPGLARDACKRREEPR